jgi:Flp pilus assembly protein TadG
MHFRFPPGGFGGSATQSLRDSGGVGALEFAVTAPLLIFMFVAMADLGLGIYCNMQLDSAAQYGAQYALANGYNTGAINSAVTNSSSLTPLTVAPTSFCGCPGTNGVVSQNVCGLCSDGSTAGTFARVSVTHTYTTLIPYPGLPSSFTLSSQSTVRLK